MRDLTFTAAFPFGGCGAGARGFLDASITLPGFDVTARFESVGGIDVDPLACRDFEYLTASPELCADVRSLTPADVRRFMGKRSPDCVFTSAPCQGSSALLPARMAQTQKYQDLNELALVWTRLMLAAWDEPPGLMLFENVPRVQARAKAMLRELRRLLKGAGYVLTDGHHDCGELGGLAQHRRRWLLVARHSRRCPPLLYHPPARRVRGCGEVLSALPVPATALAEAWGPMHQLPRLSWLNWVRLGLIPAGGDWRDLEGVLAEGQARREAFKRHAVERWDEPVGTIAASTGCNGVRNVADPRVLIPQAGNTNMHHGKYRVHHWTDAVGTVHGATRVGSGAPSVADPRVKRAYDAGYAVLDWKQAARTIAGISAVGCGAYAVADPRVDEAPPDGGVWTGDPRKPPPFVPVIISDDGTWHRPLTTLELAALQGLPLRIDGAPLKLAGGSTRQRRAIGNAVPPPAARAIAEQMLVALAEGKLGTFSLSSSPVWVAPEEGDHA